MSVSSVSLPGKRHGRVAWMLGLIAGLVSCLLAVSPATAEEATTYVLPAAYDEQGEDVRASYFRTLLASALDQTLEDYGPYRLVTSTDFMYQDRALTMLGNEYHLDILWTMTSRDREAQALPVRIPLMKGMLGVRVLVVRQQDLATYHDNRTLEFLKSVRAVQGHDWPDTHILELNGLQVEGDFRYQTLFQLIAHGRYDYFPRGILEADAELDTLATENLAVLSDFVLTYPSPIYFFVGAGNERLAERIETGLRRLQASGEFDRIFREFPGHAAGLSRLQSSDLKVLRLANPLLPEDTPLDEPQLWFDLSLFDLPDSGQ